MPSCKTCDEIWKLFAEPDTGKEKINLGSFEEALKSPCEDHTRMIKAFQSYCGQGLMKSSSNDVGFRRGGDGRSPILTESVENLGCVWNLTAIKKEDETNHPGKGRILDQHWVDLNHMIKWKQECLSSHGSKCQNPLKIAPISPAWLIDVKNKCIVPGGSGKTYIALSYRCNDTAAYRLHQTAIAKLERVGALEKPDILAEIPLKIRHAMSLTGAMGEQYLWADALCINHSDKATTTEQVNLMTAIYAQAVFTIIAADGEREDGIAGLKNISEPRELIQKVFPIGSEKLLVRNTGIFELDHWHEYHKRGWTYQEFKMSPRKLIFMKNEAHWLCNCCEWHEELTLGSELDKYIDPRPGVLSSGFPDLGSLDNILSDYNDRELTYDEDALAAISGLLTVFSRSFEGGFLYGLPETLLDRALAWQPQWPHTNLRKRTPTANASHIQFAATDLPSWSWLSWQGLFSSRYGEAARVNDRQWIIEETTPITEWYTSSAPNGQPFRRIQSTWFEKRTSRKDVNQALPNGWTRHPAPTKGEFRDEPMLYPDGCGQYLYRHNALPDDDCLLWYYPFDVPDIQTTTPYVVPEQTRYLFCKTWKASVWSHRVNARMVSDGNHILTLRKDVNKPQIGTLHLQTDEQLDLWPSPGSRSEEEMGSAAELGRKIELVAINDSVRYLKTFNQEMERYDGALRREERTTVLWLEWKDGVAYRLACGHVDKEAWQSLTPEPIDLILG